MLTNLSAHLGKITRTENCLYFPTLCIISPSLQRIDHSHERGVSLVRVSPLSDWYVFQQGRVHGHFTRRTLIFRFKSMGEEKWTAGLGHKGRTCPL